MTIVSLALPDALEEFVARQADAEGHPGPSEYILALLNQIQMEKERGELEKSLLEATEAFDRGEGVEATPADWEEIRQTLRNKYGESRQK